MAQRTRQSILEAIRGKLNSMSFEHTGDRELDIIHAGNAVLRSIGDNPAENTSVLRTAIDVLTAPKAPLVDNSTRISRYTDVAVTKHQENGEIQVTFERQSYTVSSHRTKTERPLHLPHWTKSEADLALFLRGIEMYRLFMPPILPVTENRYSYHVSGRLDFRESRSCAVLAKIARCVHQNNERAREIAAQRKADADAIRAENPPTRPAVRSVTPSPVFGATFSRIRPARAKWFEINPPVMAQVTGSVR